MPVLLGTLPLRQLLRACLDFGCCCLPPLLAPAPSSGAIVAPCEAELEPPAWEQHIGVRRRSRAGEAPAPSACTDTRTAERRRGKQPLACWCQHARNARTNPLPCPARQMSGRYWCLGQQYGPEDASGWLMALPDDLPDALAGTCSACATCAGPSWAGCGRSQAPCRAGMLSMLAAAPLQTSPPRPTARATGWPASAATPAACGPPPATWRWRSCSSR